MGSYPTWRITGKNGTHQAATLMCEMFQMMYCDILGCVAPPFDFGKTFITVADRMQWMTYVKCYFRSRNRRHISSLCQCEHSSERPEIFQ